MTEQPRDTNQDEYEDQDAGPTMTAPDDVRPDGKPATSRDDSA